MALIRARQPGVTRITPQNANRRFIVPSRVKAQGELQPPQAQPVTPPPAPEPEADECGRS